LHAGTAEPFRVSPPEAAAYQCELANKLYLLTALRNQHACCGKFIGY
jgi:hypothetical protein